MRLLDVERRTSETLAFVRSVQREALREAGITVDLLDGTFMATRELNAQYNLLYSKNKPDLVLLRGAELLSLLPPLRDVRTLFSHETPYAFGVTSPLRSRLQSVHRALCYSVQAEAGLREAGFSKTRVLAGPGVPYDPQPLPEKITVGVLKTAQCASAVLQALAEWRDANQHTFTFASCLPSRHATRTGSDIETALASTVLVAPVDEGPELGAPHEGGILALSMGRALVTRRTSALTAMNYPNGSFVPVFDGPPSAYIGALATFLRDPRRYITWSSEPRIHGDAFVSAVLKEFP